MTRGAAQDVARTLNIASSVRRRRRLIAAAFIGMAVSLGPVYVIPVSLFLPVVSAQFGWGRTTIPAAMGVAVVCSVATFAVSGRLIDRWGPRAVLLPGFLLLGSAIIAMSQLNGSIVQLTIQCSLISMSGTLATGIAFARAICGEFQGNRGAVLGICLGGGAGAGGLLTPHYAHWLIEEFGWRSAYLGLGLLPIVIGFPVVYFLLRGWNATAVASGQPAPSFGPKLSEALRDPKSWLLCIVAFLGCGVVAGVTVHLSALLQDRGFAAYVAPTAMSLYAFAMASGQCGTGFLLDRVRTPRAALPIFGAILAGVILIDSAGTVPTVLIAAALIGLGTGAEYSLYPYLVARVFGLRSFGQLYAGLYITAALSYGAGPVFMGWMFDTFGSYRSAILILQAAMLLALVLMGLLRRYEYAPDGSRMPSQAAA